jgi:hypothetical protein
MKPSLAVALTAEEALPALPLETLVTEPAQPGEEPGGTDAEQVASILRQDPWNSGCASI